MVWSLVISPHPHVLLRNIKTVLGTWTAGEENRFPSTDSRMFSPCSKVILQGVPRRTKGWNYAADRKETTSTSSPDFLITASQCAGITHPPTAQAVLLRDGMASTSSVCSVWHINGYEIKLSQWAEHFLFSSAQRRPPLSDVHLQVALSYNIFSFRNIVNIM